jgi:hypothetical protein
LSFIAEERSAGIDQATTEIMSPAVVRGQKIAQMMHGSISHLKSKFQDYSESSRGFSAPNLTNF